MKNDASFFTKLTVLFSVIISTIGYSESKIISSSKRIVGGVKIPISDVPYQVSVAYGGHHTCGGALIKENLVLSAAHCYDTFTGIIDVSKYKVYAGIQNIQYSQWDNSINVKNIIIHKWYDSETHYSDIALIKLSRSFKLSKDIGLINLSRKKPQTGDMCLVTGWGATKEGNLGVSLMSVFVPIIDWKKCSKLHSIQINLKNICAGYKQGGKDSCQGDSGGPLVCNRKLVGIVSWGEGCARANLPGVYTLVPPYYKWIRTNGNLNFRKAVDFEMTSDNSKNDCDILRLSSLLTLFGMSIFLIFQYDWMLFIIN